MARRFTRQFFGGDFTYLQEAFRHDVERIAALTELDLTSLGKKVVQEKVELWENPGDWADRIVQLCRERNVDGDDLQALARLFMFVGGGLSSHKTRGHKSAFLAEFKSAADLKGSDWTRFRDLLSVMWDSGRDRLMALHVRDSTVRATGVSQFRGFGAVADVRAIIPNYFLFGDDIDSYKPRVVDFQPVALVTISVKEGEEDVDWTFQADAEALELLVDSLRAVMKDMDAAAKIVAKRRGRSS